MPGPGSKHAIADMITGYGVSESVRHFYNIFRKDDLRGKKVIIQGWGNVASAAALYLSKNGVLIVGIIDKNSGIIDREGLKYKEIASLFNHKKGNKLDSPKMKAFSEINEVIWDVPADIFIPAAASKLVTRSQIDRLIRAGTNFISCGANVPFEDDEVFFGPTANYTDQKISMIPDFIANCGMAPLICLSHATRDSSHR